MVVKRGSMGMNACRRMLQIMQDISRYNTVCQKVREKKKLISKKPMPQKQENTILSENC